MASNGHIPDGYDAAIMKVDSVKWSGRTDIVAAGRFVVTRLITGMKITTVDAYLLTDGNVELWEDDDQPGVDRGGDYSGHPHDDWRPFVEPLFKAALEKQLADQQRRADLDES